LKRLVLKIPGPKILVLKVLALKGRASAGPVKLSMIAASAAENCY
jgi:hypothetical protein